MIELFINKNSRLEKKTKNIQIFAHQSRAYKKDTAIKIWLSFLNMFFKKR